MSLVDEGFLVRPTERGETRPAVDASSPAVSDPPRRTSKSASAAPAVTALASSDFAIAVAALQRGVTDIEDLHDRCARLRSELADAEDRQRTRLLALKDEILHWRDMVSDLADQYQDHQTQLQDLKVQHGLSRETASREQNRADTAERRLLSFERLVLSIHDQILAAIVKDRCDTPELAARAM